MESRAGVGAERKPSLRGACGERSLDVADEHAHGDRLVAEWEIACFCESDGSEVVDDPGE
jgi:hypothetical protein